MDEHEKLIGKTIVAVTSVDEYRNALLLDFSDGTSVVIWAGNDETHVDFNEAK